MTDPHRYDTLSAFLRARKGELDDLGPATTQQEIGNAIGYAGAYVSQLIAGRADRAIAKWDGKKAVSFFRALHLPTDIIRAVAERFDLPNVITYLDLTTVSPGVPVREGQNQVKYKGTVSAGLVGDAFAEDEDIMVDIPDFILRHYDRSDIFALDVNGDSMLSDDARENLPEGTRVFFHCMLRPSPGDIVSCRLEHHDISVVKIYRPNEDFVTLESRNRSHRPIIIDESNPAHIEGVYIGEVRAKRQ